MLDYSRWKTANDANWYADDPILHRYTHRYLSEAVLRYVEPSFYEAGRLAAGPIDRRAVHTDRDGAPKLIRYNRKGEEVNEVWYNEGYLKTVLDGYGTGVVAYRYDTKGPERIPFFVNSILIHLLCEAESGFTCPVGLTQSVAFVLEKFGSEEQKENYLSRLISLDEETFAQGGTFLTEIQGGSDAGSIQTVAVQDGDHWRLTGEKWFASNCDADVAITLARVSDKPSTRGLGLFLMPRTLPDGSRNRITIRRLKDKLGVRAVASGELVLDGAVGYLIGDASEGFKYMAEALNVSRLGTGLAGLAIARRAFLEAMIYCRQRVAFGAAIIQYPMVRTTLVGMMVDIEAQWAVAVRAINLFDRVHTYGTGSGADAVLLRIVLSLSKYRGSEIGVTAARDAMELHGGNGYIEEYPIARLLRDAIVNPIWEGTANIQALEVLKNLQRAGAVVFVDELKSTLEGIERSGELAEWTVKLSAEVERIDAAIQGLLADHEQRQLAMAKRMADYMYDVLAAVRLLEESQYDLIQNGNGRLLLILEQWWRTHFERGEDRGILTEPLLSDEKFTAITSFAHY